ncbi:LysR family transcriptional regulator [Pseudooceanicola sp. CBS1P-1]|uniref:LysR family transcriptional regulator n=1 Tax=Pseudooceanicola albus TaxID=2692189 RepID=A0A6L7G9C9_9RHOB|nr:MULTISPECIES: LysR substrate-binding domain-containing protein [Pseudooceanicola]MBT9384362.1 LysR family transcriptional regulator [Pseudooceanicola endophyticus]MXN19900.1 LysR family transcriptional regulator [Pseudooceanicola albus]
MSIPRRFLPTISSLRALEAVDRLGSAVAAAQDLDLTHSAVSRQLKSLEEQLGVTLFLRAGKGLRLTTAGRSYARSVRDCLDDLAQASLQLRAAGERNGLSLAIPLTFGLYWMAPRLQAFLCDHPQVHINQATRDGPVDFATEKFDAAVHFGVPDWPGVDTLPLARNRLVPVARPGTGLGAETPPRQLLEMPLLHLTSRPGAWESWFLQHEVAPGHLRGALFDQFMALSEAVAAGRGAALLPDFLATREIRAGRMCQIGPAFEDPGNFYHLVWPQDPAPGPELERLIAFLRSRAEDPQP